MDIRLAIDRLASSDPQRTVFGSSHHQYHLQEPVSAADLLAFDAHHRIALPDDYRTYLEAGNGIAGPFYGVFPLGEVDDNGSETVPFEASNLMGRLDRPFLKTQAWNLPSADLQPPEIPAGVSDEEEQRLLDAYDSRLENTYWSPSVMDGCIPISHRGCALRVWLAVNGPMAGTIWNDDRADDRGLYPVRDRSGQAMTFAQWMAVWLESPAEHTTLLATGGPEAI